jgi:hypothetical protein
MNWIQKILALLQFAPSILQLILAIESAIGPGQGPLKKSIVMTSLPADTPKDIQDGVSNMVDRQVVALNAAGTFKKG